jgi:hypothetical protein
MEANLFDPDDPTRQWNIKTKNHIITEMSEVRVHECPKCKRAMIRASMYDPDGTIRLIGGEWICINPGCEDGKVNTLHCS